MEHVAFGVAVHDIDPVPISERPVNRHFMNMPVHRNRARSLVAADVLRHLHVVVVGVATFHRLDSPVELGVVLVHEHERILAAKPHHISIVLSGGPLIPVIQVKELRIRGQSVIPALLEIYSIAFRIGNLAVEPRDVGRIREIIFIELRLAVALRPGFPYSHRDIGHGDRMLGRGHRRFLDLSVVL